MAVSYKAPVKDVIFAFDVLDSYNILQKIEDLMTLVLRSQCQQ
ncbi:MAG: hypothetical protein Ct9H90mP22_4050 [Gammaproteobacteria bacterium]|nr:MAG: hypothetical protein Ct9H90mP22_4050 [Gammaproteobacteria bacterium]